MSTCRVIIVGGGAAGVAAATRLVTNGFQNVTILEAGNRLGGRCNTVHIGEEAIDLGAQWIHGEKNNVVYEIAAPLGMTKRSSQSIGHSQFVRPNGENMNPEVASALYKLCEEIGHTASAPNSSTNLALSFGDVFLKRYDEGVKRLKEKSEFPQQDVDQFLELYQKIINSLDAADTWFDTSMEGYHKYEECEGDQDINWKSGGYSNVIDLLLQKIPGTKPEIQLNVLFGKEVTQIVRDQQVTVKCADNMSYVADHVIVCVSLGVIKHNIRSMFSPQLPYRKFVAVNMLQFGVAEKLFLQFPQRWWPEDVSFFSFLLDSEFKEELKAADKEWLAEVFTIWPLERANTTTLEGWVGGNAARYISNLSDETVRDDLYFLLKRYLSKSYTIPAPSKFSRSKWFGDPHFRGVYSSVPVKANVSRSSSEDLAAPIVDTSGKPILMFAGEATHPNHFSTVHGAVETGWREADRLIAFYKSSLPKTLKELTTESEKVDVKATT